MAAPIFSELLTAYLEGSMGEKECATFLEMLAQEEHRVSLQKILTEDYFEAANDFTENLSIRDEILQRIKSSATFDRPQPLSVLQAIPSQKRIWFKSTWIKIAAAAIIIVSIGSVAYLYHTTWNKKENPVVRSIDPAPVKNDVAPGSNKAILTLADGSTVILDSAPNGRLATQGSTLITKAGNGSVLYNAGVAGESPLLNTMSTPRGGQYQLTLPDGSRVWLNAASSITYPTAFTGNNRTVTMTGEAYFEVAHNPKKPFIVKTATDSITVLGTHFNVNAYADESAMKTSLLEGSVRISNKILKPGQAYAAGKISVTNLEQDMAWKNGRFDFDGHSLEQSLRQLARWYDVNIVFAGKAPNVRMEGTMDRGLYLAQVMKGLESIPLHTRLENKNLIILEK